MTSIDNKKIYELGIFIPLLIGFAIASVYYYEDGFFFKLGLPDELIQVELSKNIKLIFGFIASSIIFLPFLFDLTINTIKYDFFKKKAGRLTIVIIIPLVFYLLFFKVVSWHTSPLILGAIFGWTFWTSNHIIETKSKSEFDFYDTLSSLTSGLIGPFLVSSSVVCMFFFQMGFNNAQDTSKFYSKPDKKTFLLRKYSVYTIFGVSDSTGKAFKKFIISKSSNDSDTILAAANSTSL